LSAADFWAGKNAEPKRVSLANGFTPGVRKDINFSAARIEDEKSTEPKSDKEFRDAYYKLKKENEDLLNKLALKDVQIRQLELQIK
jgi:coronin-1B/1C/6